MRIDWKAAAPEILRLHAEGYSTREIEERMNHKSHGKVAGVIKKAGLEPIKKTKAERKRDSLIIQLAEAGETFEGICERTGMSQTYVGETLKNNNAAAETNCQRRRRLLEEAVTQMRAKKKTYAEIADALKLETARIKNICFEIGITYSKDELRGSRSKASKIADELGALDIGLEYVGGYTMRNKPMTVRKVSCGHEFELQWHSLVANKREDVVCPVCQQERKKQKQKAAKMKYDSYAKNCIVCGKPMGGQLSATRRFCSKECMIKMHTLEQTERLKAEFVSETKTCKNCGKEYQTEFKWRATFCSQECKKAYEHKRKREQYGKRYSGKIVDTDITLRKVWKRAGGICAICGGTCDWADHYKDQNGYFVMGKSYPTIDHIKPLSKGGLHAWNNVQLACQICNSLKSDTYQEAI